MPDDRTVEDRDNEMFNELNNEVSQLIKQFMQFIEDIFKGFGFEGEELRKITEAMENPENQEKLQEITDEMVEDVQSRLADIVLDTETPQELKDAIRKEFSNYRLKEDLTVKLDDGTEHTIPAGSRIDLTKVTGFQETFDNYTIQYMTEQDYGALKAGARQEKLSEAIQEWKDGRGDLAAILADQAVDEAVSVETDDPEQTIFEATQAMNTMTYTINGVKGVKLSDLSEEYNSEIGLSVREMQALNVEVEERIKENVSRAEEQGRLGGVGWNEVRHEMSREAEREKPHDHTEIFADDNKITLDELQKDIEAGGPMSKVLNASGGPGTANKVRYMIDNLDKAGIDVSQIEVSQDFDKAVRAVNAKTIAGKTVDEAIADSNIEMAAVSATINNKQAGLIRTIIPELSEEAYSEFELDAPIDEVVPEIIDAYGQDVVDPLGKAEENARAIASAKDPVPNKRYSLEETINDLESGVASLNALEATGQRRFTDAEVRDALRGNGSAMKAYDTYKVHFTSNDGEVSAAELRQITNYMEEYDIDELKKIEKRLGKDGIDSSDVYLSEQASEDTAVYEAYANGQIASNDPLLNGPNGARTNNLMQDTRAALRDDETRSKAQRDARRHDRTEREAAKRAEKRGREVGDWVEDEISGRAEGPLDEAMGTVLGDGIRIGSEWLGNSNRRRNIRDKWKKQERKEHMDNAYGFSNVSEAKVLHQEQLNNEYDQAEAEYEEQQQNTEQQILSNLDSSLNADGVNKITTSAAVNEELEDVREVMDDINELSEKEGNQFSENGKKSKKMQRLLNDLEDELQEAAEAFGAAGVESGTDYNQSIAAIQDARNNGRTGK